MTLGLYIDTYKGVSYYADKGTIRCLFGWVPKTFISIRACKCAITKWRTS